jgi:hypothetical protein
MNPYAVVDANGQTLDTFESWAAAARYQSAWERANLAPCTIKPAHHASGLGVMMEDSRPVVALIRLIGWATSAPSRKADRGRQIADRMALR